MRVSYLFGITVSSACLVTMPFLMVVLHTCVECRCVLKINSHTFGLAKKKMKIEKKWGLIVP